MTNTTALLAVMQFADSAFPVGAFAHSSGLEQLVRDGRIATPADTERYVRSVTLFSLATSDAVAAAISCNAAMDHDLAPIVEADHALFAMKSTTEARSASTTIGRRFLREASMHLDGALLSSYATLTNDGGTAGTFAVAFGATAGASGVAPADAAAAFLQSAATSMLHAAIRLLPFSHRDVQAALHHLRQEIAEAATAAATRPIDDMRSFHPLQEIAAMRHREAPVRLFAS